MIDKFDLKKRKYIGTTSMEAEVSLIMANQAHAGPGKLVYDPFAGTGSMLLTCSAFGSLSFGSDIDGRQIRGKGSSIRDNAKQYGVSNRLVDVASFDMNQHPFRRGELFDAIVTDPPYGVRAGAKRLGRKENRAKEYKGDILVPGREHEGFSHQ
jgi:tRNA (guanine10-N2)-methyltransferase